jgi:hypothetical protein
MSKIYVGLVVPACVVFSLSASLLPVFHERGEARPLIVTFVFYVSNLSWNTTEDTLNDVRLIIFLTRPALSCS